jgi:hypothetical protein
MSGRLRHLWPLGLLVVLLLVCLVLSLVPPPHVGSKFDVSENTATADMIEISNALVDYHRTNGGSLPTSLDDLVPTFLRRLRLDPWGRAYYYRPLPGYFRYELRSLGPDGVMGTSDDRIASGASG